MSPPSPETVLRIAHVVSASMWVGAVFMASMIDWPVIERINPSFPFELIVGQGRRVFPAVYLAIFLIGATGVGLIWLSPPLEGSALAALALKGAAFAVMAGITLYGTLVSWPKLQLATAAEAKLLYGAYIRRAYVVFGCGVLGLAVGIWLGEA
ncbi:MAG TPA: hypothetical protein ENK18_24450 [Deltaproteobacteria bacterium]|nr:hypothetical protein [Deltaproteobacteria bacterium]